MLGAALRAYPEARAVHVVRDGRDVVCSLLERGWLSAGAQAAATTRRLAYGAGARFWVEPERLAEFEAASDATRAAWAWRSYVDGGAHGRRNAHVRAALRVDRREPGGRRGRPRRPSRRRPRRRSRAGSSASTTARSAATGATSPPEQLADVEREAGDLLAALGYAVSAHLIVL